MYALFLLFYVYMFAYICRKNDDETEPPKSFPMFVFGSNDPMEIVVNHTMLEPFFFVPYRLRFTDDGFVYYYTNDRFQRILRKPVRKAIRPKKILPDHSSTDTGTACRICSENKTCVVLNPCNHAGICNTCCFRMFNYAFFLNAKDSSIVYRYKPTRDHRMSDIYDDRLDSMLNDMRVVQNRCPFCKSHVEEIQYIYLV